MKTRTSLIIDATNNFNNKYSNKSLKEFYKIIDTVDIPSFQKIFFNYDLEVFSNINELLTVIISISQHPFVDNKQEEVIVKSGLASNLTTEAFQKTLKDPKLWKRHRGKMLPEEVYYHQYYDDLNTYENIFVISVIEMIASYLDKSRTFYSTLVHSITLNSNNETIDNQNIEQSLLLIDKSIRKIARIQRTRFYNVVSKNQKRIKEVTPTNILIQNPFYNRVYKFYKDLFLNNDDLESRKYLLNYYILLLLKEFKNRKFKINNDDQSLFNNDQLNIEFENKTLKISLQKRIDINSVELHIYDKSIDFSNDYLIIADSNDYFVNSFIPKENNYASVTYISPRNLGHLFNEQIVIESPKYASKTSLMNMILDSFHIVIYGSENIYSSICPCCKSRHLNSNNDVYVCFDCGTKYKIVQNNNDENATITISYLRRD